MVSLSELYNHLKTLTSQWHYTKSEAVAKSSTQGLLKNDGTVDTNTYVTTSDSRLSDSRTPTSHTHGNLQNNGQVGSTAQASKNVVTDANGKITTEDKPTIPSASSATPSADTSSGSAGTGTTWARADHKHPKSSLYAEASHSHSEYLTSLPSHNHASSAITDSNNYSNIGNSAQTQASINSAINDKLGVLSGLKVYEITDDKGTASASTMGTLFIEVSNGTTDVYYTKATTTNGNTTYEWKDLDQDILDNVDWSNIKNKPSSFTPESHTHGDITNDGKLGSAANKPLITTTGGKITTGSFGTSANTFCQGNDSRLSDARTPTSHTHGNISNTGTCTTDVTFSSKILVTNSSNAIGTASAIDVIDNVIQQLVTYGSS